MMGGIMPLEVRWRIGIQVLGVTTYGRPHVTLHLFVFVADPIFYLHHAFLDKLWWQWVGMNLSSRIDDMSGRSTVDMPYVNVTLDFELGMMKLAPTVTIREVMDIRNALLCYVYE
jgi:hypothetical protein